MQKKAQIDHVGLVTPKDAQALASQYQVGGDHYRGAEFQHWDLVRVFEWDYFQAQAIKYIMRYKMKGGVQDLEKAQHFIVKMIEMEAQEGEPGREYVDQ